MFIEYIKTNYYAVALVDLLDHGTRNYIRSFTTSQQLIDWIKINGGGRECVAVRRGNVGERVSVANPLYSLGYTPGEGDIEIGRMFILDGRGLRYPGLAQGSG
jgi:hypothetical protein